MNSETGMVQLACSSAMLGFGIGVNMPMSNIAAQTAVEPRDMGKVTSLALFFRGLGGTVGSAACGAVAGASYPSAALPYSRFASARASPARAVGHASAAHRASQVEGEATGTR